MTWFYNVKTRRFEKDGVFRFKAEYAGAPGYKDDPEKECVINKGPLPRGKYLISDPITKHPTAGPYVLRLIPHPDNKMCGRSGFLIHGGNGNGTASKGCIILNIKFRREIVKIGDKELVVK
jgi:Protein of unknown function (DUF2778)